MKLLKTGLSYDTKIIFVVYFIPKVAFFLSLFLGHIGKEMNEP